MKVLFAYDGSTCSESALDDLGRAGLPPQGEALVVTVAEVWLPPPGMDADDTESDTFLEDAIQKHQEKGERLLEEAGATAKQAAERIRRILPGWTVTQKATYGSPAWELIAAADEFKADLIVVGSHGRSAISRVILGSISQKVLTEADCSVRIARGRIEVGPTPVRLIIGLDGTAGANAAVRSISKRIWPKGSQALLVTATDSVTPTGIGQLIPSLNAWANEEEMAEHKWIFALCRKAAQKLEKAGLSVSAKIVEGSPNDILVSEAGEWHADCVFVGANAAGSTIERFLLGSTSAAVAARAHCTVEVVRQPKD